MEIDLVEEIEVPLTGFECKLSLETSAKALKDWREGYPDAGFEIVTWEIWREWLVEKTPLIYLTITSHYLKFRAGMTT